MISLLHAVILNHWLPVPPIARKEGWSLAQTIRITFIAGMVLVISTVIIGFLLGVIGGDSTLFPPLLICKNWSQFFNVPVFRLTYKLFDNNDINIKFEISQDGERFNAYTEGRCRRKK